MYVSRLALWSNFVEEWVQDNGTIKDLITAASKSFGKNSVIAAHDLTAVTICRKEDPAHRTTSSFSM